MFWGFGFVILGVPGLLASRALRRVGIIRFVVGFCSL